MKKLSVSMSPRETRLGWIYLLIYFLVLPFALQITNLLLRSPLDDAEFNFVYFAINFVCAALIFRRFLLDNGKQALQNIPRVLFFAGAGFLLYQLLSLAVGMIIVYVSPDFSNVNDDSVGVMVQQNTTLMSVGLVLLVPMVEEILFRGLFFQGLYNRKPFLAYLISMLVFAALHIVGYIGEYTTLRLLLCMLQYLPAGLILAWVYVQSDSIWTPILIHTVINLIGVFSMR